MLALSRGAAKLIHRAGAPDGEDRDRAEQAVVCSFKVRPVLASAPIMTVQLPDTGGSNGSSKGGAGKVNAVWADARSKTATVALRAASVAAKKSSVRAACGKAEGGFDGMLH
jgi:hypothetical protein